VPYNNDNLTDIVSTAILQSTKNNTTNTEVGHYPSAYYGKTAFAMGLAVLTPFVAALIDFGLFKTAKERMLMPIFVAFMAASFITNYTIFPALEKQEHLSDGDTNMQGSLYGSLIYLTLYSAFVLIRRCILQYKNQANNDALRTALVEIDSDVIERVTDNPSSMYSTYNPTGHNPQADTDNELHPL